MAYTKILPIKTNTHLQQSFDYITDKSKTDGGLLVFGYNCDVNYAAECFDKIYKNAIKKGNNLAHHICLAFHPKDNVTPEKAMELGRALMKRMYPDRQYVLAVHTDTKHTHCHIICNAVDFENYKKLHSNIYTLKQMRNIADDICKENGLSIIPPEQKGHKGQLKKDLKEIINKSADFADFIMKMQLLGYEVKLGKYLYFRADNWDNYVCADRLGSAFSEKGIRERLNGKSAVNTMYTLYSDKPIKMSNKTRLKRSIDEVLKTASDYNAFIRNLSAIGIEIKQGKHLAMRIPTAKKFIRVENIGYDYTEEMLNLYFSDRQEYIKRKETGKAKQIEQLKPAELIYNRYAAKHNVNAQIRMMNYLKEHNLTGIDELSAKISALEVQAKMDAELIAEIKAKISAKRDIINAVRNYWRLKPIYKEYMAIESETQKEIFKVSHHRDLEKYNAAVTVINSSKLPDDTLPKAIDINADIAKDKAVLDDIVDNAETTKAELTRYMNILHNLNEIGIETDQKKLSPENHLQPEETL